MSEGYLFYSEGLEVKQCREILQTLDGLSYAVVQDENSIAIVRQPFSGEALSGQAFGKMLEARWRFTEDAWEMLLITEEKDFSPPAAGRPWQKSTAAVDETQDIYLWGNHWQSLAGGAETNLQGWVQAEVDADLDYPLQGGAAKPLVVAAGRTYRQGGVPVLTRLVDLNAHKAVT